MSNRFKNVPKDILIYMALSYDLPEILSLCRTSKRFNNTICLNQLFWMNKLMKDFPIFRNIKIYQKIPLKYNLGDNRYDYKSYYKYLVGLLNSSDVECKKCGFDKITLKYVLMIPDEPMSSRFSCLRCGYTWREM